MFFPFFNLLVFIDKQNMNLYQRNKIIANKLDSLENAVLLCGQNGRYLLADHKMKTCSSGCLLLAAAVDLLIEQNAKGIFHITNRGSCSWYQFAVKILQEAGIHDIDVKPIKSDQLPRPAKRPAYSVLSMQKFIQTTGKTMQPWQLALKDYLESVKARLHTLT
jgi:dTDP-4-dehydrorhamnose reductase